ncbi:MAG: PH domain-containing protein [Stackebrandtia sp.]
MTKRPLWDSWPDSVSWRPVSPNYRHVRLLGLAIGGIPFGVVVAAAVWMWQGRTWAAIAAGAVLAFLALRAIVIGRAVRAWGYAERDDDLLIRHGLWTKRLSIVPYGRMQFIDISSGPVDRLFGLAMVKLHTASAGSDSTVPGLAPDVAAGLRDRLAERAKSEREGL